MYAIRQLHSEILPFGNLPIGKNSIWQRYRSANDNLQELIWQPNNLEKSLFRNFSTGKLAISKVNNSQLPNQQILF